MNGNNGGRLGAVVLGKPVSGKSLTNHARVCERHTIVSDTQAIIGCIQERRFEVLYIELRIKWYSVRGVLNLRLDLTSA